MSKLYATATSEKASKGQGGNKYIRVSLDVGSKNESRQVALITLIALDNGGYEVFYYDREKDTTKCLQTGEIKKGEKQKGEIIQCEVCEKDIHIKRDNDDKIVFETCPHCDN